MFVLLFKAFLYGNHIDILDPISLKYEDYNEALIALV